MDPEMMQQLISGLFPDVLGVRFLEASPDRVRASLFVRDELCTVPGVMHGGAIMAFADTLGAFATASNLSGAATTTIESKTNFLAAAASGTTIIGECTPLHRGKRTMVWQTRVTSEDGRLLAMVTQTQAVLPAKLSEQETLAAMFAGKSVEEQQKLLARLERAGATLYRGWADGEADPARRKVLAEAAEREIANAEVLEK